MQLHRVLADKLRSNWFTCICFCFRFKCLTLKWLAWMLLNSEAKTTSQTYFRYAKNVSFISLPRSYMISYWQHFENMCSSLFAWMYSWSSDKFLFKSKWRIIDIVEADFLPGKWFLNIYVLACPFVSWLLHWSDAFAASISVVSPVPIVCRCHWNVFITERIKNRIWITFMEEC